MIRRRLAPAALALLLLAMLLVAPAANAGAVEEFETCNIELPANDDESTGELLLPFPLSLFGEELTRAFVNNNGNVTFAGPLGDFTPSTA